MKKGILLGLLMLIAWAGWAQSEEQDDIIRISNLLLFNPVAAEKSLDSLERRGRPIGFQVRRLLVLRARLEAQQGHISRALTRFKDGEARQSPEEDPIGAAEFYNQYGLVRWQDGEYQAAMNLVQRSLSLARKSGQPGPLAAGLNTLGLVYLEVHPDSAQASFEAAIEIWQKLYGENHPSLASAFSNLALVKRAQGRYREAESDWRSVQQIWENLLGPKHPNVAYVHSQRAQLYLDQRLTAPAREELRTAISLYSQAYPQGHPDLALALSEEAELLVQEGKYTAALDTLQKAHQANGIGYTAGSFRQFPRKEQALSELTLAQLLSLQASLLRQRYSGFSLSDADLMAALAICHYADTLLTTLRFARSSEADKLELNRLSSKVYAQGIDLCLQLSQVRLNRNFWRRQAFLFAERGKAAVLQGAIAEARATQFADLPPQVLQTESYLREHVNFCRQKVHLSTQTQEQNQWRDSLFVCQQYYEKYVQFLEKNYPRYYSLKFARPQLDVADLQASLPATTTLMSYSLAPDLGKLYIFTLTRGRIRVWAEDLDKRLDGYIAGLRNGILYQEDQVYLKSASELYHILFPHGLPESTEQLVIVPDGRLLTVPFEALMSRRHADGGLQHQIPYLLRKAAVSYALSATLWAQKASQRPNPLKEKGSQVLLCAPVSFSQQGQGLRDLPGTAREVDSLARLMVRLGISAKSLKEGQAVEPLVLAELGKDYSVLHFATHGQVDEVNPELSGLSLYATSPEPDAQTLYAGEIFNLRLKAQLVTLSACQTGLGKVTRGEGMMGLSRAFLYAGAQNLVVSLWAVDDALTSQLMTLFYSHLAAGKSPAEALHLAKLQTLALTPGQHASESYFWAPFILIEG